MHLVDHDHPTCIGCGACAALVPEFWVMEGEKAHLIGSAKVGEREHLPLEKEEHFSRNMEAAEACPVNCIHLHKSGQKVI